MDEKPVAFFDVETMRYVVAVAEAISALSTPHEGALSVDAVTFDFEGSPMNVRLRYSYDFSDDMTIEIYKD